VVISHDGDGIDMTSALPRTILDVRRRSLGYVSQFLRVIPRVSSLDLVAERLTAMGVDLLEARARAGDLLARLNIPKRLWSLAPATFSGGEQQRVNIARGFIRDYPILLLDEPTASLDGENRNTVVDMILEAKARGAAIVGIFHDDDVRERVADRCLLLNRPE
ncbi:MAG: phosphonate C-P lyase system protein PhnL, partial [Deltaproteobacteria bacterium HGW-Deltaproteobacteria-20]